MVRKTASLARFSWAALICAAVAVPPGMATPFTASTIRVFNPADIDPYIKSRLTRSTRATASLAIATSLA